MPSFRLAMSINPGIIRRDVFGNALTGQWQGFHTFHLWEATSMFHWQRWRANLPPLNRLNGASLCEYERAQHQAPPPHWSWFSSLQMPLYIQDQIVLPPHSKVEVLSAILSGIAYGIVVVLSGNCFHLLEKKRDSYPNRMRILLPIYVVVMLLSSTWRLIGTILISMDYSNPQPLHSFLLYRSFGMTLIVTMWGADGFMVKILILRQEQRFTMQIQIWRCLVLYRDLSRGPRVGIIVFLSLLSLASFGRPLSISTPIQSAHKNLEYTVSWCWSDTW